MRFTLSILALAAAAPAFGQAGPVGAPGRYVIVHSPHIQKDTILLDTATGKTWQQVSDSSRVGEPVGWVPMARADNPVEMQQLNRDYPEKPR